MALLACACAPPPARVPPPSPGRRVTMDRLAAELASCCQPDAEERLRDQLRDLAEFPPPDEVIAGLAASVVKTVDGRAIGAAVARDAATDLYEVVNGGYLPRAALDRTLTRMEQNLLQATKDFDAVSFVRTFAARAARESRSPRADWW
jgi:hypothetical protein